MNVLKDTSHQKLYLSEKLSKVPMSFPTIDTYH